MKPRELRTFNTIGIITREGTNKDTHVVSGYASVFNSRTNIGGMFDEEIAPGAFSRSLQDNKDVCCLFNHNWDNVLGRTKNGTLRLWEDNHGLKFEVELPNTTTANDLVESMGRNDINACSFGFNVVEDQWDYSVEPAVRIVHEVELFEVSIVTMPAYEETQAALVRSKNSKKQITGGNYIMRKMSKQQQELRKAFTNYVTGNINDKEARSLGVEINGGKATIPTIIANEIISYVEQENLLRKYGTVVQVTGNRNYPVLTHDTNVKVEVNSKERDSSNEIAINKIGLTAELLEPVEFDSISIVNKKLLHSTTLSISDLVIDVMKKSYLKKEIDYMFNGTNEKAINSGSLYNKAKLFTPVATEPVEKIKEFKNAPSASVMSKARFILNKKALEYVEDLTLPNGEAALKTFDTTEGGAKYLLLGYPADISDIVKGSNDTAAVFYFGDLSSFIIQENTDGLEVETMYEVAGTYQLRNEIGFKLYNLIDGKLIYSPVEPTVFKWEV